MCHFTIKEAHLEQKKISEEMEQSDMGEKARQLTRLQTRSSDLHREGRDNMFRQKVSVSRNVAGMYSIPFHPNHLCDSFFGEAVGVSSTRRRRF